MPGAIGMTANAMSTVIMIDTGASMKTGVSDEGGHPVLLEEDLDHVGDDLKEAEWTDAVRPVAVLPQRPSSRRSIQVR